MRNAQSLPNRRESPVAAYAGYSVTRARIYYILYTSIKRAKHLLQAESRAYKV